MIYRVDCDNDPLEIDADSVEDAIEQWMLHENNEDVAAQWFGPCGESCEVAVDDGVSVTVYRARVEYRVDAKALRKKEP